MQLDEAVEAATIRNDKQLLIVWREAFSNDSMLFPCPPKHSTSLV